MRQTLLLRLAAPMQSWGTVSRFSIRDTGLEPSKSGVFGLLCAAMGISRQDDQTLNQLRTKLVMGVRVDREGLLRKDFHTALNVRRASGGIKETEVSERWYLADANFLVGLESNDRDLLLRLNDAIASPVWQLSLGRKSFLPCLPIRISDHPLDQGLQESLQRFPWTPGQNQDAPEMLRVVLDSIMEQSTEVRTDDPISFQPRRFTIRYVRTEFIPTPRGGEQCI
jgi:CRISPR system Cascade subunit CasD